MQVRKSGTGAQALRIGRRRLLGSSALSAAALALGACGSRGGTASPGNSSGTAKPRPGGTVSVNVQTDPFDWDLSYIGKSVPNSNGIALAYESLLTLKRPPEAKFGDIVVQPKLAEKWEAPDATTYTFHLRPNVRFANVEPVNGRPMTAADVVWSYEYWSRTGSIAAKKLPQAQFDWFFEGVDSIQAPDDSTVVVRFKQPFAPFLSYAASDYSPVVPHEIFDQDGHLKNRIAGTGPYQSVVPASQKGSRWSWKKNPTYWNSGLPYIDEVRWLVMKDTATSMAAFQTKQLDWLGGDVLNYQQATELKRIMPTATQFANISINPLHLYMNIRTGPLADGRVRQAISLAMDRDEFIRTINGGQGAWALAGAFPDTFSADEVKQIIPHDPQKAKQLLAAAGYANGLSLDFTYPGNDYGDIFISEMQLFQAQLKPVGINLNLKNEDKSEFSNNKKIGKFTITLAPKGSLEGDIDSYLFATFYSKSKANYGGSNDPQLDNLLLAQRREADPTKRKELIRQAVKYVNETAQGLAVSYGMSYEFAQPALKNYSPQFGTFAHPQPDSWLDR
jgi:peptide/nickel transport system substrate-binding protein